MAGPGTDFLDGLLVAAALGDQAAFAELYRQTAPRLTAVARRMTGSPADASDILQETYVRIWRNAAKYDPARGFAIHWMVAVLRNLALDHLRSRGRTALPLDEIGEIAAPEVASPELARDVRRCLSTLSADQARAIKLAFYRGYSYSELAERLDTPLGTLKSWIRRGLAKLKLCLDHDE